MADNLCENLEKILRDDSMEMGNGKAVVVKSGVKRKLSAGAGPTVKAEATARIKTESTPSRPPSSLASSPPFSPPSSPEPTQPLRKKRRMNARSKSWIMLESYKFVSEALEKVESLRRRKGYDYKKAIGWAFGKEHLPKSTFIRHYRFYLAVDAKHREEWTVNQQDRKWAEFWEEFSINLVMEPEAKEEEGDADEEDEGDEEEPDDEPFILKLEDAAPVVRRGVVKEEPDLEDVMDTGRAGVVIKDDEDDGDDVLMKKRRVVPQKTVSTVVDDSDDSDIVFPWESQAKETAHVDVKPLIHRDGASNSKSRKGKEPYVPKGTIIDISSSSEQENNTDDSIRHGNNVDDPIAISD